MVGASAMISILKNDGRLLLKYTVDGWNDPQGVDSRLEERGMRNPVHSLLLTMNCFLWGYVSTTSHHFDGDRTDIHDTFSLVWAILIRTFGLSSPWLIDEPNAFGCDGELSGRHLVMQQCPVRLCEDNFIGCVQVVTLLRSEERRHE